MLQFLTYSTRNKGNIFGALCCGALYLVAGGEVVGRISTTCEGVQTRTHMNCLIAKMYFNWSYLAIATAIIFHSE